MFNHLIFLLMTPYQGACFLILNDLDESRKKSYGFTMTFLLTQIIILYLVGAVWMNIPMSNPGFALLRMVPMIDTLFLMYKGSWKRRIFRVARTYAIVTVPSLFGTLWMTEILFSIPKSKISSVNGFQNVGSMVWTDMVTIVWISAWVLYHRKDRIYHGTFSRLLALMLFPVVHLGFLYYFFSCLTRIGEEPTNEILVLQLIYQQMILILVTVHFFSTLQLQRSIQKEAESQALQSESQHIYQYYLLADQKYSEISKMRHDVSNQTQAITHLMNSNRQAEANEMIQQLQQRLEQVKTVQYSCNPIINVVLTLKIYAASQLEIDTDVVLNDTDNLPFAHIDLCNLFSNLFDNAVEACNRLPENTDRFIEIRSARQGMFFMVVFKNSCFDKESEQTLRSSKRSPGHGLGLQIVRHIAEVYHGTVDIQQKDGKFHISVLLDCTMEQKQ